jgi:hypothetical protein
MQDIDAMATLASYRYSPDTARSILTDAMTAGAVVRMGVRVTYSEARGFKVARASRDNSASRTRRGAQRARARR